jgi:hypothetical protein
VTQKKIQNKKGEKKRKKKGKKRKKKEREKRNHLQKTWDFSCLIYRFSYSSSFLLPLLWR